MPSIKIDSKTAVSLLSNEHTQVVHTFQQTLGWAGCDMQRDRIVALIEAAGGAEITDEAAHFDHYLCILVEGRRTFVDTDMGAYATYCDAIATAANNDHSTLQATLA